MTNQELENVKVFAEYFSLTPLIKCGNNTRVMTDEEVIQAVFGLAKYLAERLGKNKIENDTEVLNFEFKKRKMVVNDTFYNQ